MSLVQIQSLSLSLKQNNCKPKMRVLIIVLLLTLITVNQHGSAVNGGDFTGDYSKLSGIIIPGFASTQLRAWSILDCPYSPLDFNPLDLVWLDTTKLLSAVNCWLKCMILDPYNQTDHPECRSRPDSGLSAITELDPGYITGPLSSVWKEWIKWCIEFGIEANAIIAVPYDWRLSPSKLEERDLYFHKLKLTFETALKLRGGPSLVFAHSLGNNVFRYFLEWLKLEIAPKHYFQWLDEHIHAYFAVGAPLLGSIETVKASLSGLSYGLPISEGTARLMFNSFASSIWMLPFSKNCRADNAYWKHFSGGSRHGHHMYHCEEQEFRSNFSGFPTNIINIEIPSIRRFDAYPSVAEVAEANLSSMECGLPTQLSFSAREISDGTFFKAIEDYDPDSKRLLYQLEKYHNDPILNPLTPWDRPPIKNVFCIYGLDSKTEVGYYFAPSGKPYPDNWIITDVIFEVEGSLFSRIYALLVALCGHFLATERPLVLESLSYFIVLSSMASLIGGSWVAQVYKLDDCKHALMLPSRPPYTKLAGGLISKPPFVTLLKSGDLVEGNPGAASGDDTVPYNSLSFCKNWLGSKVNITRTPQPEHDGSDVQVELNVEHHHGEDIVPNMTRSPRVKYITFYEDSESIPGKRTAVWELDKASHRNIVRHPVLMRELWLQMWHDIHPDAKSRFVTKAKRGPLRDEDCFWDYGKARCAWPEYCEYRYIFGDVHLGQSCRLKNSSADLPLHYL